MAEEPPLSQRVDLEPDVERLHRPLFREPHDPSEGREHVPWWLWTAIVLAVFWGGFYLGRFGGDFGRGTHQAYPRPEPIAEQAIAEVQAVRAVDPVAHGQDVYRKICQACHQANGGGIPGAFPPLVGSRWVTGRPEHLIAIVLHGVAGPIEVAGETYNAAMPAWGNRLSDDEVAAVATFVRQWESNDAPAVAASRVAELRAQTADRTAPWSADALREQWP